ncbi:sensor histidine kinase [Clostridium grantii]|uniref:Histidine kinase n=1 Tax=Clostridium grantii DSM 8605 TaxID=1121316 RepID=A0A1M5XS64_9CLOT|nr:histidine kinase [Clostridium grantii]SHI02596.1 Histidine kinase [Clostridium grantii DSM 8605]
MAWGKNKKKLISLEKQLSVLFAGLYFSIYVISASFLMISIIKSQKEKINYIMGNVDVYVKTLENDIQEIDSTIWRMYAGNKVYYALSLEKDEMKKYKYVYELKDDIELMINTSKSIDGVFIYYDNYKSVIYKMSESIDSINKEMLLKNNESIMSNIIKDNGSLIQHTKDKDYYTIYYIKDGTAVIGLIDINKGIDNIGEDQEGEVKGIVDEDKIFFSNESEMILNTAEYSNLTEGISRKGNEIIYVKDVEGTNLKVFYASKNFMLKSMKIHQYIALIALFFSIYPALKIHHLLSRQILQPLADMTKTMQVLQTGQWDVEFHVDTNLEEIENVKKALIVMTKEITNLKIQTYEEKNRKQYAQLQYLQLQLNPHFYINCLKLIQARLQLGYNRNVENFLIELSFHFRYLMKKATEFVKVEEEMKFVYNYLEMTKELFSGSVASYVFVDEDAKEKKIPMLAIQTFVENAIKYARKDLEQEMQLTIKITHMKVEEGEFLNIVVKDNGIGYPQSVLNGLNQIEEGKESEQIGISNLQKRIELLYKKDYNWYFYNQNGAISELVLPCVLGEEANIDSINSKNK